jgi:hypothetical protein
MNLLPIAALRRVRPVHALAGMALALALFAPVARAQSADAKPTESKPAPVPEIEETFYLSHATAMRDLQDLQTALRNVCSRAKIYTVASEGALTIRATPDEMEAAKKVIAELDRPRRSYRVTFTIADTDAGKPDHAWHLALIVIEGEKAILKEGQRVPLVTGMNEGATSTQNAQVQYMDVGINIEASLDGGRLHAKVEQSRVGEEKSGLGAQDPIVHQVMIDGYADLPTAKPFVLGSLDLPDTTRHEEISVSAELIK